MMVRYGRMNLLGMFQHKLSFIPKTDTRVVVKTEKGLELGYLVGQLSCYKAGHLKLSEFQIKKYFGEEDANHLEKPAGNVVRIASQADISEERHLRKISDEEIKFCKKLIKQMKLPMKIVDAEHIFGGERIIFYFMADGRVDFRELVKRLAQEYQSRIEMRQVGSRDEAKLLGDIESCGQQCCCQRFLKMLKPVSMRMAKMQKATLDPSKISGYCGRLKCCLRYEDKTYTELKKQLPPKNTVVKTQHGQGQVVDTQILTQIVLVEYEEGKKIAVPLDELEIVSLPENKGKKNSTAKKTKTQKNPQKNLEDDMEESEPESIEDVETQNNELTQQQ